MISCKDRNYLLNMKFNKMKHSLLFVFFILSGMPLLAQYVVSGGNGTPLLAADNRNNHLVVYLLDGMNNAQITYTSSDTGTHQWYKYNTAAASATPIACTQTGNTSYIADIEDGYGYFVGSYTAPSTEYVWIIDYSLYVPKFNRLYFEEGDDLCEYLKVVADVDAKNLIYKTPLGGSVTLNRTYKLSYPNLKWQEDDLLFIPEVVTIDWRGIISEITVDAPLQDTHFTLTGDDFSEYFGKGQTMESSAYKAVAIEAHGFAETDKETGDNELSNPGESLGGSGPITYTFTGYANEPVAAFYIWKITHYNQNTGRFDTKVRYTDRVLRYTFEEAGAYTVMLEVIDSQSVCVDTTQVFSVNIGETLIQIPNFFSPGSSIGSNDEFKVAFTSLLSFQASIYNRWGNLLYQWTDPTKGWDGRVSGKFVPSGAYVVIVEYTDTNGKKRSESKTLNILRSKNK